MKILVTGATGLLGGNLVLTAQDRGHSVVAALHRGRAEFPGAEHVSLDLADFAGIAPVLDRVRADWIIHCAAFTDVDWCEAHAEEAHRLHVAATGRLAAAARAADSAFLYVSTDSVFCGDRGNYSETDSPRPINIYSRTKLDGEGATLAADGRSLIARINLYGWNLQAKRSLGEWVLAKLEAGETVPGFSDVTFNPLLSVDLANTILDLAAADSRGLFHLGSAEACTKYEFARAVAGAFGLDPAQVQPSAIADRHLAAARPRNTSLNVGKLRQALGHDLPGIKDGLDRFRQTRDNGYLRRLKSCHRS